KGLNALAFFAFTDLFGLPWLTVISWLFPPFWITAILKSPGSWLAYGVAFLTHTLWFGILLMRFWKKV
ncbi:MAG: hypothetical protein JXB49_01185, partial [Bacteroidales bacterium]|nr:hypothetical protein [Bacteroidales bacterium]